MTSAPDLDGIRKELLELEKEKPYIHRLVEVLKTLRDDDPQFLIGVVDCVVDDEEDAQTIIDWVQAGENVSCSSTLLFAVELDQLHRPEKYDFEDE